MFTDDELKTQRSLPMTYEKETERSSGAWLKSSPAWSRSGTMKAFPVSWRS